MLGSAGGSPGIKFVNVDTVIDRLPECIDRVPALVLPGQGRVVFHPAIRQHIREIVEPKRTQEVGPIDTGESFCFLDREEESPGEIDRAFEGLGVNTRDLDRYGDLAGKIDLTSYEEARQADWESAKSAQMGSGNGPGITAPMARAP